MLLLSSATRAGNPGTTGHAAEAARWAVVLSWLLPAATILVTVGWLGLIRPTETRYAEIAREMVVDGNWLIPRIEGIPHLDKPPLAYWASAAGQAVLGGSDWGARLGVALASAFMLWATAGIARTLPGSHARASLLAAPLLASSALFFVFSRQLASDIFLAAGVVGFYRAYLDSRHRAGPWPFVALAACFMAKGPIGFVLTVVPVLAAAAWVGDANAARPLRRGRGWLLFAAIALPWYVLVVLRVPGLLTWFMTELWGRYATTAHHRRGAVYYFLPVVLAGALPWTCAALAGAWRTARDARPAGDFVRAALVAWVVLPLVFFTTARSKLPAYILPVFPALAVLAAVALAPARRVVTIATGVTLLGVAAALAVAGSVTLPPLAALGIVPTGSLRLHAWVAALAVAASALLLVRRRTVGAAALVLASLLVLLHAARTYDEVIGSPRALVGALREQRRSGEPVVEYYKLSTGLDFYLDADHHHIDVLPRARANEKPVGRGFVGQEWLAPQLAHPRRVWMIGPEAEVTKLARTLPARATVVARGREEALVVLEGDADARPPGER